MQQYKVGSIIKAKVTAIKHYGAFIETRDGIQGLIHISEIANSFIIDINYYLKVGQVVELKVLSVTDGKINGTLNFDNRNIVKKTSEKYVGQLQNEHLKYGFKTLEENMFKWKKDALNEIKRLK